MSETVAINLDKKSETPSLKNCRRQFFKQMFYRQQAIVHTI